mmetsp:Transcript_14390/g.42318  ORF Transcript_14390/g.42318 Transcript_14390/m.42318 type:complete len:557 (-) Transcript_14390:122-1792(-)
MVHPLAEELDRRLGAVHLEGRHVEVVDKHCQPAAERRTKHPLAPLVYLGVDDVLRLIGRRLRREVDKGRRPLLRRQREDMPLDVRRLTGPRRADVEERPVVVKQRMEECGVARRVECGHDDRRELGRRRDLRLLPRDCLHPRLPGVLRLVKDILEARRLRREEGAPPRRLAKGAVHLLVARWGLACGHLAQKRVELWPRRAIDDACYSPDERKEEQVLQPELQSLANLGCPGLVIQRRKEEGLHQRHKRAHAIHLVSHRNPHREHRLALLDDESRARWDQPSKQVPQLVCKGLGGLRERVEPRCEQRLPADLRWLDVHHAAARDGGRRGYGQVLDLENHRHVGGHGNHLARHEAELLVVVQHRVHVLDPDRVDGAVEDHPLEFLQRDARLLRVRLRHMTDEHRCDSVGPLASLQVKRAVQLVHRDRLWIHCHDAHLVEIWVILDSRHGRLQHSQHAALATTGWADQHHAMPHDRHFVELDALDQEVWRELELEGSLRHGLDLRLEIRVLCAWLCDAGEDVFDDRAEEKDVVAKKLRQVRVADRAEHRQVLVLRRIA